MADFLIGKNRAYGDSALNPKRFFAKGDAEELIRSRIDDKLNRIFQGKPDGEDPLKDLTGYYILLQIAKKRRAAAKHWPTDVADDPAIPEEVFSDPNFPGLSKPLSSGDGE